MRIITKRPFEEAAKMFPNQRQVLMDLYKVLCSKNTQFKTPEAMRQLFPTLDNFKYKWYVLNIGGNHLRLIAAILFKSNIVYVKHIVTHAEYDKLCDRYRRGIL